MQVLERNRPSARHASWAVPPQPRPRRPDPGWRVGAAVLAAGLAALGAIGAGRRSRRPAAVTQPGERGCATAARQLNGAAAILAFSVLTDSAVEHYRGAYDNPAMYFAPAAAAASLANSLHMALTPPGRWPARTPLAGVTLATGLAGLGFHSYNLAKREGGLRLVNLFYGAPLGAPAAIALAGLAGLAASRLDVAARQGEPPRLLGRPAGPLVGLGAAAAMLGTVAEAGLLHFRGAYHDPFMFVPVTLPPAAAAVLAAASLQPQLRKTARGMLRLTALAGLLGVGFHLYGISRNMGGFYNWSQNLLNGPPVPAPPSFTGVALAGLAALRLMEAA